MALSKRERNLTVATGVLVVPFAIWLLAGALGGSTKQLRAQKQGLVKKINEAKDDIRRGREAQARLDAWNRQSLPHDSDAATSRYSTWLLQLCESEPYDVGFKQTIVKPMQTQILGDVGKRLTFSVSGEGSLEQLTRWLYGFYSADYLHRLKSVTIRPQGGSEKLDIDLTIEALALAGASDEEGKPRLDLLPEMAEDAIDEEALDKYCEVIAGRAIFSRYTPPPPVREEGPPRVDPPSRPMFDHGKFTYVTGITEVDGRAQVWIETRTSGKKFRLFEGESFEVGPLQAKILEIRERTVTSEVDGKQYSIALGQNLREAEELGGSE